MVDVMRCLVTGGCGFIGGHLVRKLVELGHEVIVVDLDSEKFDRLPTVGCFEIDICDPVMHELVRYFKEQPGSLDVIFHLAAVSRTVPAMENPVRCIETNVLGTCNVLEAARQYNVPRVVVSSSNVVYAGATPYRDSKRAVDEMVNTYIQLYDQPVIGLRYSNVYGPGIPKGDPAVFAMLRDSHCEHGYATVTGDGTQTRDFTHVSDIVEGNLKAWQSNYRGTLDLCTGVQTSINNACAMLKIPVKYIDPRPGDIQAMVQDRDPALTHLGWKSTITIEDGISDIWSI